MLEKLGPGDLLRLRKLLAMTASDLDGEALNAMRMANAILTRAKVHWIEIFNAIENADAAKRPAPTVSDEINSAFDTVLCSCREGGFRSFIESLQEQWERTGSLSPKQRGALFKAAKRANSWDDWDG